MGHNGCCINDLRDKEVINICDGRILGYVDDIEIDICSGKLIALIVPCESSFLGFAKGRSVVILWECIEKIGEDAILVKLDMREFSRGELGFGDKGYKKRLFF